MEQRNIRSEFLEIFTRKLIENSYNPEKDVSIIEETPATSVKVFAEQQSQQIIPIPPKQKPQIRQQPKPQIPKRKSVPQKIPQMQNSPPQRSLPTSTSAPGKINLGKIVPFLLDPSVFSVESPGPEKNLLINKGGAIQAAPIKLSKEEIDAIMEEISEKTRIPVHQGLFKAAIQDLLVTAVISDFIGTRFIIQKRSPFRRY